MQKKFIFEVKDGIKDCNHCWVNNHTVINRFDGHASKESKQKCVICGATKFESKKYIDERVIWQMK
jgi:hypothetical protein